MKKNVLKFLKAWTWTWIVQINISHMWCDIVSILWLLIIGWTCDDCNIEEPTSIIMPRFLPVSVIRPKSFSVSVIRQRSFSASVVKLKSFLANAYKVDRMWFWLVILWQWASCKRLIRVTWCIWCLWVTCMMHMRNLYDT